MKASPTTLASLQAQVNTLFANLANESFSRISAADALSKSLAEHVSSQEELNYTISEQLVQLNSGQADEISKAVSLHASILTTEISECQATVSTLAATVQTVTGQITALQSDVSIDVDALQDSVARLSTTVDQLDFQFQQLLNPRKIKIGLSEPDVVAFLTGP